MYTISSGEAKEVGAGVLAKRPYLENGRVVMVAPGEKRGHALAANTASTPAVTVEESSVGSASAILLVVTEEDIRQELEATPAAEIAGDAEATPSGEVVEIEPEATGSAEVEEPTPTPTPEPTAEATSSAGGE